MTFESPRDSTIETKKVQHLVVSHHFAVVDPTQRLRQPDGEGQADRDRFTMA